MVYFFSNWRTFSSGNAKGIALWEVSPENSKTFPEIVHRFLFWKYQIHLSNTTMKPSQMLYTPSKYCYTVCRIQLICLYLLQVNSMLAEGTLTVAFAVYCRELCLVRVSGFQWSEIPYYSFTKGSSVAIVGNFHDKNDVLFATKMQSLELHDKNTLFGFKFVSSD